MADTLELEVATPERELLKQQVSDVQIPGKNGYMGILPGHAPLLGLLGIGTLTCVSGGTRRYFSIHGGFLEVLEDHVRVLADVAEVSSEIDLERAKNALKRAQEQDINPALGVDPAEALNAMARAQARVDTAQMK
jgi:F-type H+-transporting ATPase subunit epsilon